MPWWVIVDIKLMAVVSWPPPMVFVETKRDAYLPANKPFAQRGPVASQKA
jgi:hypothetical protein